MMTINGKVTTFMEFAWDEFVKTGMTAGFTEEEMRGMQAEYLAGYFASGAHFIKALEEGNVKMIHQLIGELKSIPEVIEENKKKMHQTTSTLERLLFEDGITLPEGGVEREIKCFNPHHDDKSPSCSVNVAQGVYYCHGCNISGNAFHYLVDFRGLQKKDAMDLLKKEYGWQDDRIALSTEQAQAKADRKSGLPRHTKHLYNKISTGAKKIAEHDYRTADGMLVCRVLRYEKSVDPKTGRKSPKILPFTPAARGGWWVTFPMNDALPDEDRRIKKYPLYRLPEMVAQVKDNHKQIWIVEGEKCVDSVLSCNGAPGGKPPPCTTLMGAKKNVQRVDLAPLAGKPVLLVADTDEASRDYMKRLGHHLHDEHGCSVRYVLPPGTGGYDVADAIGEGGWKELMVWMKNKVGVTTHKKISMGDPGGRAEKVSPVMPMSDTDFFKVLGIAEGDSILILNKTTQEIHKMRRTGVFNEGTLLMIAPLSWWGDQCTSGGFTSARRRAFGDAIIRAAEAKGYVDIAKSELGRGAHKLAGYFYYNLGDKLLLQDEANCMTVERPLSESPDGIIFRPGMSIKLHYEKNVTDYARSLYEAIMRYRWASYTDGRVFAGWLVTAIVGGALPFRPMLWLQSPSGSGKTYLLENVMGQFFKQLASELAQATEAGMIGMMASDSLPCIIDEFEPEKAKVESWQNILTLIRISSGGKMGRLKGTAEGGFRYVRPRFSVIVSSVDRPKMSDADMQRFYHIKLSLAGVKDWPAVKTSLEKALTNGKSAAIRSHIIRNMPEIVDKTHEIETNLVAEESGLETRRAQMVAALTAGAGFLSGDYTPVLTGGVVKEITQDVGEQAVELLNELMGQVVMASEKSRRVTIAECLQYKLGSTAQRYGFRMELNEHGHRELWCALSLNTMQGLLKNTKYANTDLNNYLKSLPGAFVPTTSSGANKRAYFGGPQRSIVVLPLNVLEAVGLDKPPEDDEFALENQHTSGDWHER